MLLLVSSLLIKWSNSNGNYVFQDAKEHLAALADKLGPSLTEIDVCIKLFYLYNLERINPIIYLYDLFGIIFRIRWYKYECMLPNFYRSSFVANIFSMSFSLGCSVVSEIATSICRCCWTRYMFSTTAISCSFLSLRYLVLWDFHWQFFCPFLFFLLKFAYQKWKHT